MQLKTSSLIARKFTAYVSGLLLLLGILLNGLFFSSRYRWETQKLQIGIKPKPIIQIFGSKGKKQKDLPFVPLFNDVRNIPYNKDIEWELNENALRNNISTINDNYIMYFVDLKTNEIRFTHIEQQMRAQERLLWMSLMFIVIFSVLTYLLSHIFVKSSFYRANKLLEYVQSLNIHNLDTQVPLIWPVDDEIQIIANKLQESLDILKSQTDNLKYIISYASHELKTPLMSMSALIDVWEKTGKYNLVKDKLKNTITSMSKLIEQLLSQLKEQSKHWATMDTINIHDTITNIIHDIQLLYPSHTIHIIQKNKEISAYIAKEKFYTIINNILQNACKYSQSWTSIEININESSISIKDHGIGIHPDHIDKIRWEFYRIDQQQDWHGLWLSLVKRIIEQYGWRIQVQSEPNHGSEFIIYYT